MPIGSSNVSSSGKLVLFWGSPIRRDSDSIDLLLLFERFLTTKIQPYKTVLINETKPWKVGVLRQEI